MDGRRQELLGLVSEDMKAQELIDEILFLEDQLKGLKKLPFINVNPKNPMQQKATPAARLYKELLQQYNASLRLLYRLGGKIGEEVEEESPLRKWAKERNAENAGSGDHRL